MAVRRSFLGLLSLASTIAIACSDTTIAPEINCTDELGAKWTAYDTTVQVGQSLNVAIELSTCGGGVKLEDVIAWTSRNDSIASVVSILSRTARITAKAPGVTFVDASGAKYGSVGVMKISVQPAP